MHGIKLLNHSGVAVHAITQQCNVLINMSIWHVGAESNTPGKVHYVTTSLLNNRVDSKQKFSQLLRKVHTPEFNINVIALILLDDKPCSSSMEHILAHKVVALRHTSLYN